MVVLEFPTSKGCYACVRRIPASETSPVNYKVEHWIENQFYFSKSFDNFEKAELHYWDVIRKEFL